MPGALLFQPDPIMIRSARGMAAPAQDTVADEVEPRWTCTKVSSSFMQRPGRGAKLSLVQLGGRTRTGIRTTAQRADVESDACQQR